MRIVIDTSSLLSLVRYYIPFDDNFILFKFIEAKVKSGEIIILDKVYEECKYISKGIIVETLSYISNKKILAKTEELLPNQKFFNQLENQFINGSVKNKLTSIEFENRKNSFLNSADAKIILFSINHKQHLLSELYVVTEETEYNNDNKSFKKLPTICKILEINVLTLPNLLRLYKEIGLSIVGK